MSSILGIKVPSRDAFITELREIIAAQLAFNKDLADGPSYRIITRGNVTFIELHTGGIAGDYRELAITVEDVTEESE